jgi:hypothetical protein
MKMFRRYILLCLVLMQPTFGLARCRCALKPYMVKPVFTDQKKKDVLSEAPVLPVTTKTEPCPLCLDVEGPEVQPESPEKKIDVKKIAPGFIGRAIFHVRNLAEPIKNNRLLSGSIGMAGVGILAFALLRKRTADPDQLAAIERGLQAVSDELRPLEDQVAGQTRELDDLLRQSVKQPAKEVVPVAPLASVAVAPTPSPSSSSGPSAGQPVTVNVQMPANDNHQNLDGLQTALNGVNTKLDELLTLQRQRQEYQADVGAVVPDVWDRVNALGNEVAGGNGGPQAVIDVLTRGFEGIAARMEQLDQARQALTQQQDAELTRLREEQGRRQDQLDAALRGQQEQLDEQLQRQRDALAQRARDLLADIPASQGRQAVANQVETVQRNIENPLTPFLQQQFDGINQGLEALRTQLTALQSQPSSSSQTAEVGNLLTQLSAIQEAVRAAHEREQAFIAAENKKLLDVSVELQKAGAAEHQRQVNEAFTQINAVVNAQPGIVAENLRPLIQTLVSQDQAQSHKAEILSAIAALPDRGSLTEVKGALMTMGQQGLERHNAVIGSLGDVVQQIRTLSEQRNQTPAASTSENESAQARAARDGLLVSENENLRQRVGALEQEAHVREGQLGEKTGQLTEFNALRERLAKVEGDRDAAVLERVTILNAKRMKEEEVRIAEEANRKLTAEVEALRAKVQQNVTAERIAKDEALDEFGRLKRDREDAMAREREVTAAAQRVLAQGETLLQRQGEVAVALREAKQLAEQQRAQQEAEQAARLAQEQLENERRQQENQRAREAAQQEEERRRQEDLQQEQAAASRVQQEAEQAAQARRAEEQRLAEERAREAARVEQERAQTEEAARAAAAQQEAERAAQARAEEQRLAGERAREADRVEQERLLREQAAQQASRGQQALPLLQTFNTAANVAQDPVVEKLNTLINRVNQSFTEFSYDVQGAKAIHDQVNQAIQGLMRGRSSQTPFYKQLQSMSEANNQSLNRWKKNYVDGKKPGNVAGVVSAQNGKKPGNVAGLVQYIKNYKL